MRKWPMPILILVFLILLSGSYARAQLGTQGETAQDWLPHLGPVRADENRILVVSLRGRPAELREKAESEIGRFRATGYHAEVAQSYLLNDAQLDANIVPLGVAAENLQGVTVTEPKYLPEGATLAGVLPTGSTQKGPWTAIRLIYRLPDGHRLEVSKWNVAADRGWVFQYEEMVHTQVNGQAAVLYVLNVGDDDRLWRELTWGQNNVLYGVYGDLPSEVLQKVAESLTE